MDARIAACGIAACGDVVETIPTLHGGAGRLQDISRKRHLLQRLEYVVGACCSVDVTQNGGDGSVQRVCGQATLHSAVDEIVKVDVSCIGHSGSR